MIKKYRVKYFYELLEEGYEWEKNTNNIRIKDNCYFTAFMGMLSGRECLVIDDDFINIFWIDRNLTMTEEYTWTPEMFKFVEAVDCERTEEVEYSDKEVVDDLEEKTSKLVRLGGRGEIFLARIVKNQKYGKDCVPISSNLKDEFIKDCISTKYNASIKHYKLFKNTHPDLYEKFYKHRGIWKFADAESGRLSKC